MRNNIEANWFSRNSWPAEKSSWLIPITVGLVIALALFTLGLSLVAWFIPKFLAVADSRWVRLLPAISILMISAAGLRNSLRKRREASRKVRKNLYH